jgi:electron transport complex protein RnfE
MDLLKEFSKGLISDNPVFRLMLGMCSALAITTSVQNGLGMGIAVTVVLVLSNVMISLLKKIIPDSIRIPVYIVIMAGFVSMIELSMKAYVPALYKSLGIFIPLIVVNCIILGRAEAFANRNPVFASLLDGLGMGLGYTLALVVVSTIREILGTGKFFGFALLSSHFQPALLMILPPGAFITLGLLLALLNKVQKA